MHICAQPQRTLYSFHTRSTDTHFPPRSISNTAPYTAQSPGAVLKYSVRSPRNMAMDCSMRTPSTE